MNESIIRLIFGMRGEGKTYYAKKQVQFFNRVIIFDTLGQYSECGLCFFDVQDFKNHLLNVYRENNFRLVFQPVSPLDYFDNICDIVFTMGNVAFFVEEIGLFVSPLSMPFNLANIIQRGRHKNVEFFGINQRPFGIPRLLTSQAKEIISFRQREPRDIDYFREFIGEEAEKILTLPKYHYLKWNYEKIVIEKS
jgi:hypothetical protein